LIDSGVTYGAGHQTGGAGHQTGGARPSRAEGR